MFSGQEISLNYITKHYTVVSSNSQLLRLLCSSDINQTKDEEKWTVSCCVIPVIVSHLVQQRAVKYRDNDSRKSYY